MLCIDPRLTSTEDFIDIHGDTALTRIAGFSLWRLLVCVFKLPMHFLCVYTYWCTKFLPGIMPDIMHIFDLALTVDCILSALILWSTPEKLVKHNCCFKTADVEIYLGKGRSILRNGQSREQKLLELKTSYKTYCSETAIKTRASDKLFTTKKLMPAKVRVSFYQPKGCFATFEATCKKRSLASTLDLVINHSLKKKPGFESCSRSIDDLLDGRSCNSET